MLISNPKSWLTDKIIWVGWITNSFNCSWYVEWYYRNALRWDTFYPLTQSWLNFLKSFYSSPNWYEKLVLSWKLLTNCDDKFQLSWENSIYWQIDYFYSDWWANKKIFSLQAWRQLDLTWNSTTWNNLVWNFQVYQNYYPAGFVFDSTFWIWLVWGKIETGFNQLPVLVDYLNSNDYWFSDLIKSIKNNTINFKNQPDWIWEIVIRTLINLTKWTFFKATWIVWISSVDISTSSLIDKLLKSNAVWWNQLEDRVVTKSAIWNISSMLNIVRQSSSLLCRNKRSDWTDLPSGVSIESRSGLVGYRIESFDENRVLCFDTTTSYTNFYVTQNLISNWKDTIIVIKWNPQNKIYFEVGQYGSWNLNVFLEPGVMLLNNSNQNLTNIWSKWIIDPAEPVQYSWTYMKWRFYINWILAGFDNTFTNYPMTWFNHKLVIEGWLASLNTIDTPSVQRQSQIFDVLWMQSASDSQKQDLLERIPIIWIDWMNLGWAISRKCIKARYWTDWTNCTPISEDDNFWQLSWYIKDQPNIFAPLIWN